MVSQAEVRAIAMSLPGAAEGDDRFGFSVPVKGKHKGFLWSWLERVDPKKARIINDSVIAVVVPNPEAKEMIINSNPDAIFTEPHYNGYNAVLVRLDVITIEELRPLIIDAWRCKAPKDLLAAYVEQD